MMLGLHFYSGVTWYIFWWHSAHLMVTFWAVFAESILDTLVTKDSLPAFVVVLLYLLSITAVKLFVKETINHGFSYPSCITCLTLKIRKNRNIVLSCGVWKSWVATFWTTTGICFPPCRRVGLELGKWHFFNLSPRVVSVLDVQGHAWRRYTYAYSSRLM